MRSDDEVFVNRCLEGDQPAFAFLVDKYKEVVHAYAYRKVGDYQEAEDITQEVFIKAYRKLAQLKWPHRFRSWLYTIVSNECKMWLRKHSQGDEREVPWEDVPAVELNELAMRSHGDEDIKLTVRSAMETLPDDRQLAVSLYYMSSQSVKEIASFMGVSPNSVRIKLHRARKQLGERLEKMIGKHLSKEKLRSGFVFKVVDSIRDMPIPSLPKPPFTKWAPIPVSIGVALLIGIIGYGISSGKDVSPDVPVLRPAAATFEVSLLTDLDEQEVLDVKRTETKVVALESDAVPKAGRSSDTGTAIREVWITADDSSGMPSPDGRYLTYADWNSANLGVRDLATGENRLLTNEGTWMEPDQNAYTSIWSPDGLQIAYAWFNKDLWELRTVAFEGSEPRVLYRNEEVKYLEPHQWSRDGQYILTWVTKKDGSGEIGLVSVADGSMRALKSRMPGIDPMRISISPDGRYIVYDSLPGKDSHQRDIFLLPMGGGQEVPLIEHLASDYGPVWTPDGNQIVFVSDRMGNAALWALEVADSKPRGKPKLIEQNVDRMIPMGFTRDGSFYYGFGTHWGVPLGDVYIATLDPATGTVQTPPEKIPQRFEGSNASPEWSPDGKHLAYISVRGLASEERVDSHVLVIRSMETGEERDLVVKRGGEICWSPDGRYLLLFKPGPNLYLVNAQTGDVTSVMRGKPEIQIHDAAWSHDGKQVFYLRAYIGRTEYTKTIVLRDLETGEEKELCRDVTAFALSPDGQQLAFHNKYLFLQVMPAAGGSPREVLRWPASEWVGGLTPAWTPDGLYILTGREKQLYPDDPEAAAREWIEVWRVPVEGGEPQKLGLAMKGFHELSVHPDGRQIAFTQPGARRKSEVWAMDNFLPKLEVDKLK